VKIVPFCGGLGAQIFGAVVVEHLRGEEGRQNILGDTSYFLQTPKPAKRGESINIYAWELDYYGIPINRYSDSNPRVTSWLERKLGIRARRRLEDGSLDRFRVLREALKKNWSDAFPIHATHERESRKLLEEGNLPTAVVHLRRGDYLNVATHLVSDSDVYPLLEKLPGWASGDSCSPRTIPSRSTSSRSASRECPPGEKYLPKTSSWRTPSCETRIAW